MAEMGHNRPAGAEALTAAAQRIDNLLDQKEELAEDMRELKAQIKGEGWDVQVLWRMRVQLRKDQQKLAEERELRELYASALGIDTIFD